MFKPINTNPHGTSHGTPEASKVPMIGLVCFVLVIAVLSWFRMLPTVDFSIHLEVQKTWSTPHEGNLGSGRH